VESPSPTVSTRPVEIRVPTTLVTEGALNPDARTKSAFEHGPDSRRSRSKISAFVWRISGGRPTDKDFRVTVGSPRVSLASEDAVSIIDANRLMGVASSVVPSSNFPHDETF